MTRLLFLIHRYLGIGAGALMIMWCLSGVVMMYHSYPVLAEADRVRHLTPIAWSNCCNIPNEILADDDSVNAVTLEMLAGRPVLQLQTRRASRTVDLSTGLTIEKVSADQAAEVARSYTEGSSAAALKLIGSIDYDQWTVSGHSDADRPVFHFALGDALGTQVYVSSTGGQAVQVTTMRVRFWNWLGSVPHWLYFAKLRRNAPLWTEVVIATSLAGCFLAAIGIYIGVLQWVRRPAGQWSPYRGFNLWHHIAGLLFGVLALSWVLSGLLSVNPWGWLESASGLQDSMRLRGSPVPSGKRIKAALQTFAAAHPTGIVSLTLAALDGGAYFIATSAADQRRRFNADARPAPLNDADLRYVAVVLVGDSGKSSVPRLILQEDAYYFSHHRDLAQLPVYRTVSPNGTRYYLDAVSGMLVARFDGGARAYRWLHEGLHRLDFTAAMRGRPQWDALMLVLMSGVTLLCVTGTYLGYRRCFRRPSGDGSRALGRT